VPEPAGASFKAAEVVDLYLHRPPYASKTYDRILELSPSREGLLDLGCGEGKIARPMAKVFGHVVAVDPSANMIALGKSLENGQAGNLKWVQGAAEEAPLTGMFDVVTFASSIHWMDPERLFPRLRKLLRKRHILAVARGDEPFEPPWHADWREFLAKWVPEVTGRPLDSDAWWRSRTKYLECVDVVETSEFVSEPFSQPVESFILCQHSRDTFALSKLGARRAEFHRELDAVLRPHANAEGQLTFRVKTHLTIATLRGL